MLVMLFAIVSKSFPELVLIDSVIAPKSSWATISPATTAI